MKARPEINSKDKSTRFGDFLPVRETSRSQRDLFLDCHPQPAPELGQVLQRQQASRPLWMGLSSLPFVTLGRLPGIEKTMEEEHQSPLFPKLAGGCTSPQGNEVILVSPNSPSCIRSPKLRGWEPVPSLADRQHQLSGCLGLLKCVVQAHLCLGRAVLC